MGIFGFFNKDKKETLDKGLQKTKTSVFDKLARAVAGKSKVDEDVLDDLEEVLITSDVGVDTTLKSLSESKKESLGINMSAQVNSMEYSVKKLLHFSLKTIQTTTTRGICQQTTNPMSSSWWESMEWEKPLPSENSHGNSNRRARKCIWELRIPSALLP